MPGGFGIASPEEIDARLFRREGRTGAEASSIPTATNQVRFDRNGCSRWTVARVLMDAVFITIEVLSEADSFAKMTRNQNAISVQTLCANPTVASVATLVAWRLPLAN